ncbi:MAG: cytosine permease [Sulfobacillus acidophilus]|uniref:Cytosine permease n=1 Tax=Sulfobacillus acidophilus TaxID=53633 RepID=A0A2T2WIV3_9FIRM|nr:MAG: cytosine permease [Sulfobacillus acidophilus]
MEEVLATGRLSESSDDFPLTPVPKSRDLAWWSIAIMRFGQFTTLAQLLMGATLGYSMGLVPAGIALGIGTLILLAVAIPMGIIGVDTGFATAKVTRNTGLGPWGSGVFSLVIGLSVMGWFGVQNGLFAQGIVQLAGLGPEWLWTLIAGLTVTALVYAGILAMGWLAYVTVPLFLTMMVMGLSHLIHARHPVMLWHGPGGSPLGIAAAVTVVVGSFITGAVLSPDMTRFHRNRPDVVKQTVATFVVGNVLIAGVGIVFAQWARSSNLTGALAAALVGVAGWLLFITSTVKVSDWDIYGAALALVNGLDLLGMRHVRRKTMSVVVGAVGTVAGMLGLVHAFEPFLLIMGVAVPPVAGIVIIDYFYFRRRGGGRDGRLIDQVIAFLAWMVGFGVGLAVPWGIGALNSLFAAGIIYSVGRGLLARLA